MPDNSNEIDGYNDRTFHNANWISITSGALGAGMYWNDMEEKQGVNHRANFNAIKAYVSDVDWTQTWTPYFNYNDGHGTSLVNGKIMYTFSAVRGDRKQAIVFALNNSSHWANENPSVYNTSAAPHRYDTLLSRQQLNPNQLKYDIDSNTYNPQVMIKGLLNGSSVGFPYKIDVYKTYGSGGMIGQINALCVDDTLKFPMKMPFDIGPDYYPDYAFIARSLASFQRPTDTLVITNKDTAYMAPDFITNKSNYTYLYDWGNGRVTTDTAAAVYYPAAGNYTITLTVRDKTNDTSAVYYQNVRVQDMSKKQQDAKVSIFPNPSTGSFSLAYDETLFESPRIKVYNQLGKLITDQIAPPGRVDLPTLCSGMYFISFYGETYRKMFKLVIQN